MNQFISQGEPKIGMDITDEIKDNYLYSISHQLTKGSLSANDLVEKFEFMFCNIFSEPNFTLLTNATSALDLIFDLISRTTKNKLHIVSQSIGFFGTHSLSLSRNYRLSLCDTNIDSFDFDLRALESQLDDGCNVILVTHMNGIPCDVKKIEELANKYTKLKGEKIWVVSDCCRSLGAEIYGENISFFSDFSFFSFQSKKHMTLLGEGGGIVCRKENYDCLLKKSRQFGDKESYGFNHKISIGQVLFGLEALSNVKSQIAKRISLGKKRDLILQRYTSIENLYPTNIEYVCTYYLYTIRLRSKKVRDSLMAALIDRGIGCCIANTTTYNVSSYIKTQLPNVFCENAETLSERILSISLHPSFTLEDEEYILSTLQCVLKKYE